MPLYASSKLINGMERRFRIVGIYNTNIFINLIAKLLPHEIPTKKII